MSKLFFGNKTVRKILSHSFSTFVLLMKQDVTGKNELMLHFADNKTKSDKLFYLFSILKWLTMNSSPGPRGFKKDN